MNTLKFNPSAGDRLQQQANSLTEANQFNSIAWRLSQHGDVLSQGNATSSGAAALPDSPIYRIYSMTKPLVSVLAIQLIEEGKLSLDGKVSQFIPAMADLQILNKADKLEPLQTPMRIVHLLTHTAGFSYDFLPDCQVAEKYREVQLTNDGTRSLAEVIDLLTTMPLASQPGEQWRYSVATDVLAHVVEKASGMALPELMHSRILAPLNMQDTAFHVPEDQQSRVLPMFGMRGLGQVMTDSDEPNELLPLEPGSAYPVIKASDFYRGGHGLFSTLSDYVKFMQALQTGQSTAMQPVLSPTALDLLWNNQMKPEQLPLVLGYNAMPGYGWNLMGRIMLDPSQSEISSTTGEGGWAGAASTYFWIDRVNDMSGIVMSQFIGSNTHLGTLMQNAAYSMFSSQVA